MRKLNQYSVRLRAIQNKLWVRCLLFLWSLATIYDLLLSQFVPEEFSKQAPKAWEVAIMTGNLLPYWGWLLILAGILIVASFEYGSDLEREQTETSPLEIMFDPTNPAHRFWSMVSAEDERRVLATAWQYRVEIRNNSSRTLRNVSVTTSININELNAKPTVNCTTRTHYFS